MKRRTTFLAAIAVALSLATGSVHAALNAYLKIKAGRQGQIEGSVTQPGREGSMLVLASAHEIVSPRDPASGLPTGKRQHKPFTITKPIDKATPLLLQALVTNETLTEVVINYWRPAGNGQEQQYFTITLTNASIASHSIKQLPTYVPANASVPELEEISFTYQKITWTWTSGGVTATDSWEAAPQ